jgi:hypothetical protein
MRRKVYARRAAPAQRRVKLHRFDDKRGNLERIDASASQRAVLDHGHGEINVIRPHQTLLVARNRCAPAIASGATFNETSVLRNVARPASPTGFRKRRAMRRQFECVGSPQAKTEFKFEPSSAGKLRRGARSSKTPAIPGFATICHLKRRR